MHYHPFGLDLGARMTVVKLQSGALFIHSPVELTAELQQEIDELGRVEHVVSPSRMHYEHLTDFARAYPAARFYTIPRFNKRLKDVPAATELASLPEPAWAADLDQLQFAGNRLCDEVLFFHPASHTLIVTDLLFNVRSSGQPLVARAFAAALGILGRPQPSRSTRLLTRDRAQSRQSIERILAWDFDRIVLSHGAIVEQGGKARLREAFAWLGIK